MKKALSHYSNRDVPDFKETINESIHAVESLVKEITGSNKGVLSGKIEKL
ncbi:MAG: hypothetical protein R2883_01110 [Caldisericia bacterium]